jgi:hypothetical protein
VFKGDDSRKYKYQNSIRNKNVMLGVGGCKDRISVVSLILIHLNEGYMS